MPYAVHRRQEGERRRRTRTTSRRRRPTRLERQAGRHDRAQPEGQVVRRHADHREGLRDAVEGAAAATDPKYQIASSTGYDQIESVKRGQGRVRGHRDVQQAVRRLEVAVRPLYPAKYQDTPTHFNTRLPEQDPGRPPARSSSRRSTRRRRPSRSCRTRTGGAPSRKLDQIITRALEGDAGVNAFVNGEVDVDRSPNDPSSYKRATGAKNGVVRVAGGPDFRHFTINGTSPNLKDVNVRQAIAMGDQPRGDRQGRPHRPAVAGADDGQPLLRQHAGRLPGQLRRRSGTYNPDKAKQLLDEAGWKQGSGGFRKKGGKTLDAALRDPDGRPGHQAGGRADPGDAQGHRRQARHQRRCRATTSSTSTSSRATSTSRRSRGSGRRSRSRRRSRSTPTRRRTPRASCRSSRTSPASARRRSTT